MRKLLLLAALASSVLGGCYVEDGYSAGPAYASAAPAGYSDPEMVAVSPGVQVVYDYDYPVFFNAGFYWRYDGGTWYSSRYHTGGWAARRDVPYEVRGIHNPEGYRHYRPAGYVSRRGNVGVRGNVRGNENVRVRENLNVHENVRGNAAARSQVNVHSNAGVHATNKHR
nr:hypothetical protein [Kofleriaceae bacterium]